VLILKVNELYSIHSLRTLQCVIIVHDLTLASGCVVLQLLIDDLVLR